MSTPTPAALRAAKAIMRESNYPYPDAAVPWALLIDRETGLREAAEALRVISDELYTLRNIIAGIETKGRGALARMEATE